MSSETSNSLPQRERRAATDEGGRRRNLDRPPRPESLPGPVVDTHCHLDVADGYSADHTADQGGFSPAEAIEAAAQVGITRIVQVGCDVAGSRWAVRAAETWSSVVAAVAVHPNDAARLGSALTDDLAQIAELAGHPRVRAVGETGLDYFRTTDPDDQRRQRESFAAHIAIAKQHDKTLVIHDRDAHADVLAVLDAEGVPDRVVMHCFSGDAEFARACLDRGAYLSFAGTVTFKNATATAGGAADRAAGPRPDRDRCSLSDPGALSWSAERVLSDPVHGPGDRHRAGRRSREVCAALDANASLAFGGPWDSASSEAS